MPKQIVARVGEELHRKVKAEAAQLGLTINEVVKQLLIKWLDLKWMELENKVVIMNKALEHSIVALEYAATEFRELNEEDDANMMERQARENWGALSPSAGRQILEEDDERQVVRGEVPDRGRGI